MERGGGGGAGDRPAMEPAAAASGGWKGEGEKAKLIPCRGENIQCIPPNPRRVGNIVAIHGPLDGPLYMDSVYTIKMERFLMCIAV